MNKPGIKLTKIFYFIAVSLASIFLTLSVVKASQEAPVSELETVLIELVNMARMEPLQVAEDLDLDKKKLFSGIAADSPFWDKQKWSLRLNPSLYTAVTDHAQDMLARDYFGYVSPEGLGPEQRAVDADYSPLAVHEYMSLFTFQNYIPAEQAALELFKRFFQDEVQGFKQNEASIFDHALRDIGLTFQGGKLTLEGRKQNVYLFVLQYGTAQDVFLEESLMRMLNATRNNPLQALDLYDIEYEKAADALGDNSWVLYDGLPPLMFYSTTIDWRWQQRLSTQDGADDIEVLAWEEYIPEDVTAWEAAEIFFEKVFNLENEQGFRTILNPLAHSAVLHLSRSNDNSGRLAVEIIFGQSEKIPQPYMLMGNVFQGGSDQGSCWPEKGLENLKLVLKDIQGRYISSTLSGPMGSYRMVQQPGLNTLELWSEADFLLKRWYKAESMSSWLDMEVWDFDPL